MALAVLDCPGTHSVDQAGLKLSDPPASASQVLGLKVYGIYCLAITDFYTFHFRRKTHGYHLFLFNFKYLLISKQTSDKVMWDFPLYAVITINE